MPVTSSKNRGSGAPFPHNNSKFDHMEKLYEEVEAGQSLDVTFNLGESTKLYAHKTTLNIVSAVFKEELATVGEDGKKSDDINLPEGTSLKGAKAFIKFMYLQRIDVDLDQETLFEVISLCDKYLIQDLVDSAINSVVGGITKENCVAFCEASLNMKKCSRLMDVAFATLTKNIEEILEKFGTSMSCKMWKEILMSEGPNAITIKESVLFEQLLKWKNINLASKERGKDFQSLLPLIRFPLMDLATITQVVKPSGVLTSDELLEIIAYIVPSGDKGTRYAEKFLAHRRKSKVAKNSASLHSVLEAAKPNDFIQVLPGEYLGPFTISTDKITLKGAGPTTVLTLQGATDASSLSSLMSEVCRMVGKAVLDLKGNNIKISDLQFLSITPYSHEDENCRPSVGLEIEGSGNIVTNTRFKNCYLKIGKGNHNIVSDIQCETGYAGVVIKSGEKNLNSKAKFDNLLTGIITQLTSSGSIIKGVDCTNVKHGLMLMGNDHIVEDISYTFTTSPVNEVEQQVGVWIAGGCGNIVNRVKCEGYEKLRCKNNFSLAIKHDENEEGERIEPKNNVVTDCGTGPVDLGGENNSLYNVKCGFLIRIMGSGHKLKKCSALTNMDRLSSDVTYTGCKFTVCASDS